MDGSAEGAAAEAAFGTALPAADAYAVLLAEQGVSWGLIGPREVDRLWSRHLLNSVAIAPLIAMGKRVLDLGSGAGLPGIPLSLARPDLPVTLVEPLQRRVRFLELCQRELGLPNVTITADRAERLPGGCAAEVVTARALAPLPRLLALGWPLVRPGGQLLAIKGRGADKELAHCDSVPVDLACSPDVVRRYSDTGEVLVTVVRFRRSAR